MLCVISPAKRLDWPEAAANDRTTPAFRDDAAYLAGLARECSAADLQRLMGISDKLAVLNRDRFAAFQDAPAADDTRPAIEVFSGDTYAGLDAGSLSEDAVAYAQRHLRILSGLYGLLRPCDAIQPYRLEMGTKLANAEGKSLYAYWGSRLAASLDGLAGATGSDTLLNCASQEYFGAVDREALGLRVVTPVFLEEKNGEAKVVSFYAKTARGAMARFVMENRLRDPADLADFDLGGYRHAPDRSTPDAPVFVRGAA